MSQPLQADDPASIGPYRLIRRLGAGGMGQVFLGESGSGRRVAVKLVRPEIADNPGFRQRFRREIELAIKAGGFWSAPVVDADPDGPTPWVASQYVPGPSLAEHLAAHGPFDEPSLRRLGAGLAEALTAFHREKLVHRDLKPSNVLLLDDGPRVIDFGISKALEGGGGTALTATGTVMGTPGFMSPEQATGREAGPPSDVFSLGSVLNFAATGRGPFGEGPTHALLFRVVHEPPDLGGLPPSVRPLVEACLAKSPESRPRAAEVATALTGGVPTVLDPAAARTPTALDPRTPTPPHAQPTHPAPFHPAPPAPPGPRTPPRGRQAPSHEPPGRPAQPRPGTGPAPAADAFAVEDGGGAAFRRRMRRPVLLAALALVGVTAAAGFSGAQMIGLALGGVLAAACLLAGLIHALPYLHRSAIRVSRDRLTLRLGQTVWDVPWQDLSYVTYAPTRTGCTLTVRAVLKPDVPGSVPAPLLPSGSRDAREVEYHLISENKAVRDARALRLQIALESCAGGVYRPTPGTF
ncbi:protein kinase domain-containing protein [Streptomyces sp. ME19-01-6]|uniref:protein kinase domain-containing protein n=1 Tax=Streptomyces sp. ME19-01-6 TaxID=3028686 RepID=UPI0029A45575|nr:protein kinase [Streptomyces sp. ME19-01-6]MDX3230790.1 protein kinase [Streptomyces sp. ME19-01-6]